MRTTDFFNLFGGRANVMLQVGDDFFEHAQLDVGQRNVFGLLVVLEDCFDEFRAQGDRARHDEFLALGRLELDGLGNGGCIIECVDLHLVAHGVAARGWGRARGGKKSKTSVEGGKKFSRRASLFFRRKGTHTQGRARALQMNQRDMPFVK
jgi:hypothetical protein